MCALTYTVYTHTHTAHTHCTRRVQAKWRRLSLRTCGQVGAATTWRRGRRREMGVCGCRRLMHTGCRGGWRAHMATPLTRRARRSWQSRWDACGHGCRCGGGVGEAWGQGVRGMEGCGGELGRNCVCACVCVQVLDILGSGGDARAVETDLVMALGFDQFEVIKELLRNRLKVVWCTRLSRAQVGVWRGGGSVCVCGGGCLPNTCTAGQGCGSSACLLPARCCWAWASGVHAVLSHALRMTPSAIASRLRWAVTPRRRPSWRPCAPHAPPHATGSLPWSATSGVRGGGQGGKGGMLHFQGSHVAAR